ncbi:hypothetical protein [Chitinophaga solisilvae]|uniref:hypothetical protein n=1 Tax=Chitinophaga solisilvae TaxID=1233460 RepID=UPI001920AF1D|nr:hypothetical protein [Chitinophaga solisilvae]
MNWHERFKEMKAGLGYTNADIAEITGNTADSIKSSTQPNNEIPRWLKLAIVVYETTLNRNETVEMLRKKSKEDVLDFIRKQLSFEGAILGQLRHIDSEVMKKEHRRFEMSGYESFPGQCTLHNLAIVNEFAYLGIYDYTEYLFLDFYKGTPTLYLKYFSAKENLEFSFSALGTVDIIFEIFEKTIFSDRAKRRR